MQEKVHALTLRGFNFLSPQQTDTCSYLYNRLISALN